MRHKRCIDGKFAQHILYIKGVEYFHLKSTFSKEEANNIKKEERANCSRCHARIVRSNKRLKVWDDSKDKYMYKWDYHVYINESAVKYHI